MNHTLSGWCDGCVERNDLRPFFGLHAHDLLRSHHLPCVLCHLVVTAGISPALVDGGSLVVECSCTHVLVSMETTR